ncbi:MAG: tRNA (N(6)-L-threonylcarbamoyladenosine(37)-C(2))-methylthiotransferase MtaB [Polyangiaceae bacterium]|nr:tRNA (N(6)-L-threonylcarbamoyladenosine(37)-C(2))-methylthiotransferase MtaB [Polyangiaceae bacterium]
MSTAALITFGCKVNQVDSRQLEEALRRGGFRLRPPSEPADAYVINSCSVTAASDRRCRQTLRQLRRRFPEATLVVTGCYAETQAAEVLDLPEVDLVVGNCDKSGLVERLQQRLGAKAVPQTAAGPAGVSPRHATTRAFLAIQNGCDRRCAYCIVPRARGPSRSKPFDEVVAGVSEQVARGYAEVVLTGINLGSYGRDLAPQRSLAEVLHATVGLAGRARVRLSSVEPAEIDDGLCTALGLPHVCPHVHLPLQSGADRILEAMGRPYSAQVVRDLVQSLVQRQPETAIGADVMVGFPGETAADFDQTAVLLRELPIAYLHVFSYSPRPGTAAERLCDGVTAETKASRSAELRRLGQAKWHAFQQASVAKEHVAVVARKRDPKTQSRLTIAGNYLRIYVPDEPELVDHLVRVRVTELRGPMLVGAIVEC